MNSIVRQYLKQQQELGISTIFLQKPIFKKIDKTVSIQPQGLQKDKQLVANNPKAVAPPVVKQNEIVREAPLRLIKASEINRTKSEKEALLKELYKGLDNCSSCTLGQNGKRIVFGRGNPDSNIMFIGDFPEESDAVSAKLFSGQVGELLTKMVENGMKLKMDEVYITTFLKCPPLKNRNPGTDKTRKCISLLTREIEIIQPKYIVCLGKTSAIHLFNLPETTPLRELRQKIHKITIFNILVTYSPQSLIELPENKRDTWEDLQLLMRTMNG